MTAAVGSILRWDFVVLLPLCIGSLLFALVAARRRTARPGGAIRRGTERRASLRAAEEDADVLIDSAGSAILTFDASGRIESANPAALRMLDFGLKEFVGRDLSLLLADHRRGGLAAANWIAACAASEHGVAVETLVHRRDGTPLPVHLSTAAVKSPGGRFIAILTDLSDIRRREQAKDNFVALVSHELRTPLTAIQGALALVRAQATGQLPEKMRSMIDIAHGNAERLLRIINDILDMEKIKSGRLDYDFRTLELGPLLEQAVVANQTYAEQFDVIIVLGPAPAAAVTADAGRLTQAITNLLSNAIKVSESGGCVVLDTKVGRGSVRISVTDQGPGIPPEMRGRIFDDFFQMEPPAGRERIGTGLGLGIALSIVRDHRGTIDFVSQVGHGTTFFIDLPTAERPALEDQVEPSDPATSSAPSATGG